jgi:hypothetical protein
MNARNRLPAHALYLLIEKPHTSTVQERKGLSMGFFIFGKAHTGPLYGFLPSADTGQVVYELLVDSPRDLKLYWCSKFN